MVSPQSLGMAWALLPSTRVPARTLAMPRRLHFHRIDRYIGSQLALALLLVTLGFVLLIWLTQSLRFIQIIVAHGLSPLVFIRLTSLLVPSFVATILPITCFIVVLFIYARLGGDRELTIMRGIGLSDFALARPALAVAAGSVLLGYVLNLGVVPGLPRRLPRLSVRDPQPDRRLPAGAGRVHPGRWQHHRLCAVARGG